MASRIVPASSWRTLTWRTPSRIGPTNEWWVHHGATGTATLATLRAYERYHVLTLGWAAPGYNFAITADGTIYELRGWFAQGAHTSGRNTVSHACLLVGNWTAGTVPQPMVDSLVWLTREGHRVGALRSATISGGHREAPGQNTQCPGAGGLGAVARARLALMASEPALPPRPQPPTVAPPQEDDDLTPDEKKMLAEIHRALDAGKEVTAITRIRRSLRPIGKALGLTANVNGGPDDVIT
jgi:hypothetical protein